MSNPVQPNREPMGVARWFTPEELAQQAKRIHDYYRRPEWLRRLRQAWQVIRHGCIDVE